MALKRSKLFNADSAPAAILFKFFSFAVSTQVFCWPLRFVERDRVSSTTR